MPKPYISICIPAYRRADFLERLLNSIAEQTYRDYEVIITDDSPANDNSVEYLAQKYATTFLLHYHRNDPALGTPRNWYAAAQKANGEWIKIIHDDDWLSTDDSLNSFVKASSGDTKVIFSGYKIYYEETGKYLDKTIANTAFQRLKQHPLNLFISNLIGPPSVLMYHRSISDFYELDLKWVVDFEFFIRLIQKYNTAYIPRPLICMSQNDTQVTNDCKSNPAIELPEALFISKRYGTAVAGDIWLYDAWWRLIRNIGVRTIEEAKAFSGSYDIPAFLQQIIRRQRNIPSSALKIGALSKIAMAASFLTAGRR